MGSEQHKFVEFLRQSGQKVTTARRKVLEEVYRHHDHFDAEDLYHRLQLRHAGVSRATVYRTLGLLDRCGLVRKLDMGESRSYYEHVLGHKHHDHLICLKCGQILEFTNPDIEELQRKICQLHDFDMLSHAQQIYGLCHKCRRREKSRKATSHLR